MLTAVPDLIQPLVAYRMWAYSIDVRGVRIGAHSGDDGTWPGAERRQWVTASCALPGLEGYPAPKLPHRAPSEYCTCGFYSVKTIDDAEWIVMAVRFSHRAESMRSGHLPEALAWHRAVFGRVELAGKVIEHEHGYRAERARVLELIPLGAEDGFTGAVARLLGVPTADAHDVSTVDHEIDRIEAEAASPVPAVGGRLRQPTPVERLRLKAHRRHLWFIRGGGSPHEGP